MDYSAFIHHSHVVLGCIAFVGGLVALITQKGSKPHKVGGWVFVLGMLYMVVSTVFFMTEEFLPLAVLMGLATFYLLASAITTLRYGHKRSIAIVLVVFPLLLFIFTSIQFIRILPELSLGTLTRLLFAITFGVILYGDFKMIKHKTTDPLRIYGRHAFKMILAFGFAIMAVLRIGIKIDFFDLAFTTFLPLFVSLLAGLYVERNIAGFLRKRN